MKKWERKVICKIKLSTWWIIGSPQKTREYGEKGRRLVNNGTINERKTLQYKRSPRGNEIRKATGERSWLAGCVEETWKRRRRDVECLKKSRENPPSSGWNKLWRLTDRHRHSPCFSQSHEDKLDRSVPSSRHRYSTIRWDSEQIAYPEMVKMLFSPKDISGTPSSQPWNGHSTVTLKTWLTTIHYTSNHGPNTDFRLECSTIAGGIKPMLHR